MSSSQPINYELTVETLPVVQFAAFIADHPEVITLRFWHGQTILHKICLRQDATVETLTTLITAGAEVNAVSNFGEVPLMFAAKRGSSSFCRLLIESGADRTMRDKAGRTVIHHAVMGGSVYLVHFLFTIYDFQLDVEDERKQTTMHIAASQGSLAMVNYLLRSCKCDSKKADMFGNVALHHAAIYGHDQVVYSILSHAGLTILDCVNEKGQRPSDVCSAKGSKHLATAQVFQYVQEQKLRGKKDLHPPWCLWFWYLLMPLTFFVAGALVSELLQVFVGWYSGSLVMSVVLVYIIYLFQVHSHRIKHVSRLGNPMHAGAFGAGLLGTFLVWLVAFLPRIKFSEDFTNVIVSGFALILTPFMYYFYWQLLTSDPGYIPLSDKGMPASSSAKLLMTSESAVDRFCTYCDTVSTGSVKHCKLCERCVVHMDHHCLFLLKCVATHNHRLFTMFIILVDFDIILFLISACRYFLFLYPDISFSEVMDHMATQHLFVFFVIILNLFSSIWGMFLLQWQLRLISQGYTYYDTIAQGKDQSEKRLILSRRDRCLNLLHFFKGNKVPHKRAVTIV